METPKKPLKKAETDNDDLDDDIAAPVPQKKYDDDEDDYDAPLDDMEIDDLDDFDDDDY